MSLDSEHVNFMCELINGIDNEPMIRAYLEKIGYTTRYTNLTPDDPAHQPWFIYHVVKNEPLPNGNKETYSAQYTSFGLAANLAARKALAGEHDDIEEWQC